MSADNSWLETELQRYGAVREGIIRFDGRLGPEHLPHLDLWPAPGAAPAPAHGLCLGQVSYAPGFGLPADSAIIASPGLPWI